MLQMDILSQHTRLCGSEVSVTFTNRLSTVLGLLDAHVRGDQCKGKAKEIRDKIKRLLNEYEELSNRDKQAPGYLPGSFFDQMSDQTKEVLSELALGMSDMANLPWN